jgi:hypothetical protein
MHTPAGTPAIVYRYVVVIKKDNLKIINET